MGKKIVEDINVLVDMMEMPRKQKRTYQMLIYPLSQVSAPSLVLYNTKKIKKLILNKNLKSPDINVSIFDFPSLN